MDTPDTERAPFMEPPLTIEQHAAKAVPELDDYLLDPSRLIIVVERHDGDNEQWANFQGVTIRKVRDAYLGNCQQPELQVSLRYKGTTPPDHLKMSDIAPAGERYIVLSAVAENAPEDAPAHPPATPAGASVFSLNTTTTESRTQSQTPSRQPLQPINRQLSVPPRPSWDELKPAKPEQDRQAASVSRHGTGSKNAGPVKAAATKSSQSSAANDSAMLDAPLTEADDSQEYQPRDVGNPFAASQEEDAPVPMRGRPLQELTKSATPERLEAGVRPGLRVLSDIAGPLEELTDNADAQAWLEQIEATRKLAVKNRTVVGVVGNTGAGKSSVINAMLDEERSVPTNCMRACTAVVTEMSYNDSKNEGSWYWAEVEFIHPGDWRKEVKVLFAEVFDEKGAVVKEVSNPDTQAGIAYAKIRAVYHKHTKEMLSRSTIDSLMQVKTVRNVLGTTKRINERESSNFYRRLQHFVDSKEKGGEKLDKNGKKITNP
ncbi:hypothetical protein LTR85_000516 [Meristemomyces frigidus]|nr:hypothetical protein LTR85_000516 [Meristemomyces frigidus]